jgi:hypothetical protein
MREQMTRWTRLPLAEGKKSPVTTMAALIGVFAFARVLVAQLRTLAMPLIVYEGHHWRQAFTYGVAWNYAHTTLNVLQPRMFVELASSNVVPMEAPLYPLLSSILMRLMGDSVVAPRLLSWLGLAATTIVLWKWLGYGDREGEHELAASPLVSCPTLARVRALPDRAGLLAALALSPMVSVEFRVIQPEPFAAGLAIASAYAFARYANTDRTRDVVIGALLFGLSLLAKPVALGIAPGLVAFAAWGKGRRVRRALFASSALVFAFCPWAAWDRWAHYTLDHDLGGAWIIEIGHPALAMWKSILGGEYTRTALLDQIPSFASSWWLVPAVVAGLFRGLAERRWRRVTVPFLVWLAGYTVQLLAVGIRLHSNAYYVILALAPLAFFAALGLGALVTLLDAQRSSVPLTTFRAALAVAVLLPLGSLFSLPSSWSNTVDIAQVGFERNRFVWTSDIGLARLLFVWVVVLGIAAALRPRRTPLWVGVAGCLLLALLGTRPAKDALQYFRFYAAVDRRDGFDAELRRLRDAVDRYSKPEDRVLLSPGGTYREPFMTYFYYARRNGFPLREAGDLARFQQMVRRGARLYLQVEQLGPEPHVAVAGRVLASGAWWRLSCVADDGCVSP